MERIKLFHDHFQNYKVYGIPKAQLIIADIPYNIGKNAYGSNPSWYVNGDNANGESEFAGKQFFDTDKDFRPPEFMHFCSKMLIKEPKEKNKAPCMIVLCSHKDLGIAKIQTPYTSKGAEMEMQIAKVLGYEIKTVDEWAEE